MTIHQDHSTIVVPGASTTTRDPFDVLDEIVFDESEQAQKPILEIPRLYWLNGLPAVRENEDTIAVGLHIRAGIDPILDQTMQSMGIQYYHVQHKKPDKDGNTAPKPYYCLRNCSLFVVAERLQSTLEMNRTDDRRGIAFNWGTICDDHGKPEVHKSGKNQGREKHGTTLKLRVFVQELYQRGYYNWFPLTISGFGTDEILKALNEQYRVLETYSELRRAQGKNAVAPFYLFSVVLTPGRSKLVGEPPDQGTIYPIMAQVPDTIDREYLRTHLAPKSLIEEIREGLLTETILWSMDESTKIKNGRGDPLALPAGSAPSQAQVGSPANGPQDEGDRFVQEAELKWILGVYCGNNEQKAHDICGHFGVASTDQLRMSHFRQLVAQAQSAGKH
jgi:hypothetical protein